MSRLVVTRRVLVASALVAVAGLGACETVPKPPPDQLPDDEMVVTDVYRYDFSGDLAM